MKKLFSALLCACLTLTGCGGRGDTPKISGDFSRYDKVDSGNDAMKIRPIYPQREMTHETYVQDVRDLCAAARDSMERMQKAAAEKGAEALRIAAGAEEACGQRLTELSQADLDAETDEQLQDYMLELSDIISTLRHARDAIGDLP